MMTKKLTLCALAVVVGLCACAAAPDSTSSGDIRNPAAFAQWRAGHEGAVTGYEAYLQAQGVGALIPSYQLMRSASDWQKCNAEPFAVPPEAQWADAASVLRLLKALKTAGLLSDFEMHSGYRDAALNQCAGGAARSAHLRAFAADITPNSPTALTAMCGFWREHGAEWKMGLGQYPTGRIHVDTTGYRTWGKDGSSKTSPCLAPSQG